MRLFYLILCLIMCATGSVHAKNQTPPLSMDYPAWSTTKRSFKRKGYRPSASQPLVNLETEMLTTYGRSTKQPQKVVEVSRRTKRKGLLENRTAVFFEQRFVKLSQVVVFSVKQRQNVVETIRTLEEGFIGQPGVLYEAATEGRSARWQYQTAQELVRISILMDDEGGVLKVDRSIKGSEETLEQYRRHVVARLSKTRKG